MATATGLAAVDHIVVLMLENRSFDHLLGFLYTDAGNTSPPATPTRASPALSPVRAATARRCRCSVTLHAGHRRPLLLPRRRPGRGVRRHQRPVLPVAAGTRGGRSLRCRGFVTNYAQAIQDNRSKGWYVFPGTAESWIMGCHTSETLPVLSALARGFLCV